jgi:hypothetical protein
MKQFGIIGIAVIIIFVGGIWLSNNLSQTNEDGSENTVLSRRGIHYHPELEIYIKGEKIDIPANIGLIGGIHNPIHTHDSDGIVHLEYGNGVVREDDTRLDNFFKVWGKEFSSNQIFEYTNGPEGNISMTVNGELNTEYENYEMKDGDKIVIQYE